MHLIAAVSADYGLEGYVLTRENVNSDIFCRIFNEVKQQGDDCVILLDNVSYLYSKFTRAYIEDLHLQLIYNVPQTP